MLDFRNICKNDIASAGGKGANLGEMIQAGIPVPDGAVLSVDAYDRFVEENNISCDISPEETRNAIINGKFPPAIEHEIISYYRSSGNNCRVAVRSSATAEDIDDASFAGQLETHLNIIGEENLLSAIKKCYASLWSDRAVSYRKKQGYDKCRLSLAVVIQSMVESEKAGVVFTANPTEKDSENMLINASYGLGESVVSGIVNPDEYICGRNGKIINSVIASKKIQVVYSDNDTITIPVPENIADSQVLSDEEAGAIVREALNIEKHYGCPMDIEWGIHNGKVYILQARKITVISSDNNFTFPEVKPFSDEARERMMFNLEKMPFVYYPLDYDMSMLIGNQRTAVFEKVGMSMGGECTLDIDGVMTFPEESEYSPSSKPQQPPKEFMDISTHIRNTKTAENIMNGCHTAFNGVSAQNFGNMPLPALKSCLETIRKIISDTAFAKFMFTVLPMRTMQMILTDMIKKSGKDYATFELLLGLSYKTADINRDMGILAGRIKQNPELAKAITSGEKYDEIMRKFPEIKPEFDKFLSEHGAKADFNCYCLTSQSWNENPQRFLQVLTPALIAGNADKAMDMEQGRLKYEKIVSEVKSALGKDAGNLFEAGVEAFRMNHVLREDSQYLFESCYEVSRQIFRQISRLISGNTDYSELLWLYYDELLESFETGTLSDRQLEIIERRKAKRPYAEAYWNYQKSVLISGNGSKLKGISGSKGIASGKVCVITEPEQFHKLKKGEILVCHYTAPEWTPLFTLASAVVSDTGGSLSHAAIVAREYGIPAVLGVGNATEILRDGDIVSVNGIIGEVEKLG